MLELATIHDRDAVNALARQVHELHVNWRPDIYRMAEEMYTEERFRKAIDARQLYVRKEKGVIAGYLAVSIRVYDWEAVVPRKVMVLDELCVDQKFRRQGIGVEMMQEFHALARAFGCADMQLSVYPQNEDAVKLYQKCGFMIRKIDMQRKV